VAKDAECGKLKRRSEEGRREGEKVREVRGQRRERWKVRRCEDEKVGPAAVGGALQASLFELRPDKSLEV
jgi:hypothetical protein